MKVMGELEADVSLSEPDSKDQSEEPSELKSEEEVDK